MHNHSQHVDHDHSTNEGCCFGHDHDHEHHFIHFIEINEWQFDLLSSFIDHSFLPLARFAMHSTKADHLSSIALDPVYLTSSDQTLEQIKEHAEYLLELMDEDLIIFDYDQTQNSCDYSNYETSVAYQYFAETVKEGSQQDGYLFDLAKLELGSMALTPLGQDVVEQIKESKHE